MPDDERQACRPLFLNHCPSCHHCINGGYCLLNIGSVRLFASMTGHQRFVENVSIDVQIDGITSFGQLLDGRFQLLSRETGSRSSNDRIRYPNEGCLVPVQISDVDENDTICRQR